MENLNIIREFPRLKEYLKVLTTTGGVSSDDTIGEIFEAIEKELEKARR